MRCFSRKAARAVAGLMLLPALLAGSAALAQDGEATGAPRPILPGSPPGPPPERPLPPAPPAAPDPAPEPVPAPELGPAPVGIVPGQPGPGGAPAVEVGTLGAVDEAGVGLLDAGQGGFGADMWADTPRDRVAALLPRLPVATTSPAMNDLARRLLLSRAAAPAGPATGESLFHVRVERLFAGGFSADVWPLVQLVREPDPALFAAATDALLLENDDAAACGAASAPRLDDNAPYWLRVRAYCYLVDGNDAGASLTAELMRAGQIDDPVLYALIGQLAEATPAKITSIADPSPVILGLVRRADLGLPPDVLREADPALLRAIARHHPQSPPLQRAAALAAAEVGAIAPDAFAQILAGLSFKAGELRNPAAAAAQLGPAEALALYLAAARAAKDNSARVTAFAEALQIARRQEHFALAARLAADDLRRLVPEPALSATAPEMIRALAVAGVWDRAQDWSAILEFAGEDTVALSAAHILFATALPSEMQAQRAAEALRWRTDEAFRRSPRDPFLRRVELEAGLLDALGYFIPPDVRMRVLQGPVAGSGPPPDDRLLAALEAAAAGGRVGETVLTTLVALGPEGPRGAHPLALFSAVAGLSAVGLESEARALALEALTAQPFGR